MGEVRIIDSKTIEVYRNSSAWATNQKIYARIEFDRPMKISKVNNNAFAPAKNSDSFFAGSILAIAFSSPVKKGDAIQVKVALSPTSVQGAKLNMSEIEGWNFNKIKALAQQAWNAELSKIEIPTSDKNKATIFYSALYHTMIQPNISHDIDGQYRGRDDKIHTAKGFDYYTVFSLWDTFRAANPLYTLIEKKRTSDFINTFLTQYEQGGRLPVWELASNETNCMIGYHSVSVIADAMMKGITGFDYEKAFEASKQSAMLDHLGLSAYKKNGFISIDDEHESVSKTLEYAYDDWCIAQMAIILNKKDDYEYFMQRSQSWKNLFDPETKFMRPKKNGGWDKPFDPREVNNNFTEGNSWQYSFFVPQDIPGMVEAYGGKDAFEKKLDQLFAENSATTGREQVDITGLIGQYAHGNEPSHHMAYLYTFVGKPEKTQDKVKYILDNFYKNAPDGLIGNEDCGQMSAWYVLSSIGIYDVCPGLAEWTETKPYFENIKINFEDGKSELLNINSPIWRLGIANTKYNWIQPKSAEPIIPVPVIQSKSKSFKDKLQIEMASQNIKDSIYYISYEKDTDYSTVKMSYILYSKPFFIDKSSTINAYVKTEGKSSAVISAEFVKRPNDFSIETKLEYNPQYSAGGKEGLIDGILGSENWRKGDWQGYQSRDFEAVIDLKSSKEITSVDARFLQDSRAWILMPTSVDYLVSADNVNFTLVKSVQNTIDPKNTDVQIKEFAAGFPSAKARYIKVIAKNFGKLPEWHQGFGGDAFIFYR